MTNFLHHFDQPACVAFLEPMQAALGEGGRIAVLDFIPNEDRVTPQNPAQFALTMLALTPAGDAYTFSEFERMLESAGFWNAELHAMPEGIQSVVSALR